MKLEEAIAIAKTYAEENELSWVGELRVVHTHSFWQLLDNEHVFEISSAKGTILAHICGDALYRVEYSPKDEKSDMLPLWVAYPGTNSVTSAWRQSYGEQYKIKWHRWFDALSPEAQENYRVKFPEPNDPDLMWTGFYTGFKP